MSGIIAGFEQRHVRGDGIGIDTLVGGSGPPLLLSPRLTANKNVLDGRGTETTDMFTVVVPDLRGG